MKKILFLLLFLIGNPQLYAQLFSKDYHQGYFITNDGKKTEGLIYFENTSTQFLYKENKDAKSVRYRAEDVSILVARTKPLDSFSVKAINNAGRKLYFAKLLCADSKFKLYKRFNPVRGAAPTTNSTGAWDHSRMVDGGVTYFYEKNQVTYELTRSNFKEILSEAFADEPKIVELLLTIKFNDLKRVIIDYNNTKKA